MNLPRPVGAALGHDEGLSRRRRIAPVVYARPCSPPKRQPAPGTDHPADRPDPAPTIKVTEPAR